MANIREVAKKAGVAACTVSRVMNGSGQVSAQTRQKIMAAMEELDYVPNELARGMFKQRAGIIAMLVPNIRHPFFSSLASSIEKELYQHHFKLMLCSTGDDIDRERDYMKMFKTNIVDGVIMAVNNLEKKEYENFGKPLVMLDYLVNDGIPLVVSDHCQGGRLAAEAFIASGCQKVIHICALDSDNVISYQSHQILEEKLKDRGIDVRAIEIKWNDFDFEGYLELAKLILEKYPDIDGVMAADMPAAAFLKAAIQLGKSIPEELSVIAYDGTYVNQINLMKMTTIRQPVNEISGQTIKTLMHLLNQEPLESTACYLPMTIENGQTTFVSNA